MIELNTFLAGVAKIFLRVIILNTFKYIGRAFYEVGVYSEAGKVQRLRYLR
jgi:hypothetical protein